MYEIHRPNFMTCFERRQRLGLIATKRLRGVIRTLSPSKFRPHKRDCEAMQNLSLFEAIECRGESPICDDCPSV
jgi:hypothetical protein